MKQKGKVIVLVALIVALVGGAFAFSMKGQNLTGFLRLNKVDTPKVNINTMKVSNSELIKKLPLPADVKTVSFEYVDSTATVLDLTEGSSQQGEFTIKFKATASGADAKLANSCNAFIYVISGGKSAESLCDLTSSTTDSGDNEAFFALDKTVPRTFIATIIVTPDETSFYNVGIKTFEWVTDDGSVKKYETDIKNYKTVSKSLKFVAS